ncbi:MAG: DNA mismatch repair endonuclease MutL [Chloroflexi bacterium]|nr:DNA mismatch repair endonuclease MutL [Chloroflexota bacterium]
MPIRVLDPRVVAQIAAGEVVERPASVVKELVENALDAGATQIAVAVRGGGVSLVQVTDNGAGIPAAEVALAFTRHATSKLAELADLGRLRSLGFRGEALASIAAVAEVELLTRTAAEPVGTCVSLRDGVMGEPRRQGQPAGTTVTVRSLFHQVPARLKFLKSQVTENGHVASVVSQYALAFPEVKFTLTVDGRETLRTLGSGRLLDSVIAVYGAAVARQMLPLGDGPGWPSRPDSLSVTGLVGSPSLSRTNRSYLSFFVNRRWVNSRLLLGAVAEAYHGLLMTGKHPVAIINLALPPTEVDVNIHPTKTEVKFANESAVFSTVQKAVRRALLAQAPVPQVTDVTTPYTAPPAAPRTAPAASGIGSPVNVSRPAASPAAPSPTMLTSLPILRVLGQLAHNYIVAEGPDGLYLIDQHAAHERVLFEELKAERSAGRVAVQGLLTPATFEVSPRQAEALQERGTALADLGFDVAPFGDRTYLVRTVPAMLREKDWASTLRELLDTPADTDWAERLIITVACHAAIRAGQSLTDEAMRALLRQLEATALPHTCPHGRPTMLHLTTGQLAREFGRS